MIICEKELNEIVARITIETNNLLNHYKTDRNICEAGLKRIETLVKILRTYKEKE